MSHIGRAHTVSIEEDEDGFTITLEGVDELDGICRVNIQDVAEQLYDQARSRIGPWLRERDEARSGRLTDGGYENPRYYDRPGSAFACGPDESAGAYELNDPKHPAFYSTHADIWDAREGK